MKFIRIEDFTRVITGGTPSTKNASYWGGNIPWLNSGELNQGIIKSASNFITLAGLENSAARMMPIDTVLIALTGATTGRTALLKIEACANQSVTGILPSSHHVPKYLYYYLSLIRLKVKDQSYGGAQKHISQGFVKKLEIPLLPLEEQKYIVKILDEADALLQKRKQAIGLSDDYIDSTFFDMFLDSSKKKNIPLIKLEKLSLKITDGVHAKPKYTELGAPFISVKNITTTKLKFDGCKFVSFADHQAFTKRCKAELHDILYTKVGATYGRACIVDTKKEFSLYVSVALIKPKKNLVDPIFLKAVLNSSYVKRQADKSVKGAGVPDLHLIEIKKFKIPLPSMGEQKKFSKLVLETESLKQKMFAQSEELETQFQALMQKAFKGEL